MGKAQCCWKVGLQKGPWTPQEDTLLRNFIQLHGEGHWRQLPKKAGLLRCGKSCRLRWMNCLRPDIKRGNITPDEEDLIIRLHRLLGNRWALIAGRLPGRTDNEIKNFWNTKISRKLRDAGIDPRTHKPIHNPNQQHLLQSAAANNSQPLNLQKSSLTATDKPPTFDKSTHDIADNPSGNAAESIEKGSVDENAEEVKRLQMGSYVEDFDRHNWNFNENVECWNSAIDEARYVELLQQSHCGSSELWEDFLY